MWLPNNNILGNLKAHARYGISHKHFQTRMSNAQIKIMKTIKSLNIGIIKQSTTKLCSNTTRKPLIHRIK
jgi:hypothetical protein